MRDTTKDIQLRRASDIATKKFYEQLSDNGSYISAEHALQLHDEIENIKRKLIQLDTAFLRDDLQAVDYPGHRIDHLERKKSNTVMSEYKMTGAKVVIGIVITFLVGVFVSGMLLKLTEVIK